jgi:hypothetical protein
MVSNQQTLITQVTAGDKSIQSSLAVQFSATPRFMFGLKGDVSSNIHYIDDNHVLYPCGHNVVIFKLDDRS